MILWRCITKTRIYKFDPLKSHFYIVKLGFTRVYIIFLILLAEAVRTRAHILCFEQISKYEKCQNFLSENFPFFFFLAVKFSIYLYRHVFVMCSVGSSLCGLMAACCEFLSLSLSLSLSCSLSYCCVSWILSSTVIILLRKRELMKLFMLNSAEHGIFNASKSQIIIKC